MSLILRRPRSWLGSFFIAVAVAVASSGGLPASAQAKWGRPFQFAAPGTLDVLAPQLAFSPVGAAAAAFGIQDVDTPGTSQAYLTLRSAQGAVGQATPVAGASQILALAYDGRALELLTGVSPSDQICCSSAQAVQVGADGRPGPPRTLVGGMTGATLGSLETLAGGQILAAVASERGVWVVQSTKGNRFAGQHLLTGGGQMPESLATAWLGGQRTVVAWTAATGTAGAAAPRHMSYALGSRTSAPRRVHTAVTVAGGHRIDELGLAARAGAATAAWVESWFDKRGDYHSEVRAMDIGPHAMTRTVSPANRLASGLTVAGDQRGDQALTWQSCTSDVSCTVQVAVRDAHGQFGPARSLGPIDPSQPPALSVGSRGQVLVGWTRGGRPTAAIAPAPGRGFGTAVTLSSSPYALDMTVGFGPGRQALAAWTQGTLNPSVIGAAYTGG